MQLAQAPFTKRDLTGNAESEAQAARAAATAALRVLRSQGATARGRALVRIAGEQVTVTELADASATVDSTQEAIVDALREKRADDQRFVFVEPAPEPGNTTPSSSVAQQWARVAVWLATHTATPHLGGAGTTGAEVASAATASGVQWPAELVELCGLHQGVDGLLPQMRLLAAGEVPVLHHRLAGPLTASAGGRAGRADAGEIAWKFLPQFIPFAHGQDGTLFIDTRPGALSGCVSLYVPIDHDTFGARWRSPSAMLTDLAHSLETGTPFDQAHRPVVHDRALVWKPA